MIYLAQTDTTVGFLSTDLKVLNKIKKRELNQKVLTAVSSFKYLKTLTRIPNKYKNMVRRSTKKSFIYPNNSSYRVIPRQSLHSNLIGKYRYLYSTSANEKDKGYDENFAINSVACIVYNKDKFSQKMASEIFKISNHNIKKLR